MVKSQIDYEKPQKDLAFMGPGTQLMSHNTPKPSSFQRQGSMPVATIGGAKMLNKIKIGQFLYFIFTPPICPKATTHESLKIAGL